MTGQRDDRGDPPIPALFRRAAEGFADHVRAVRDEQWMLPTPCAAWDVRTLVGHLVYETAWAPELFAGRTLDEVGDRFEGELVGDDPRTAFEASSAAAIAAVESPGAMDRTVHLSYGDRPGAHYAFELMTDLLVHGWDLARAIGADETMDERSVRLVYRRYAPHEDALKRTGLFGARVVPPPGADLQTRLLALMGRKAW